MTDMPEVIQDGSREHPILVWQAGYRCHHAELMPKPEPGQYFQRVGFMDYISLCPNCLEKRKAKKVSQ